MSQPLCELRGIRKAFAGARALDGVDLEIRPGEIHALVGENGAGKSTLIRILSGILRPDSGEVRFAGRQVHLRSAGMARALGIAVAHQDPQLFHWRSALENVFNQRGLPGRLLISWKEAAREARGALDRLAVDFSAKIPAALLSASQRQQVALAGALLARPRLLILDEPTAALGARESGELFRVLKEIRTEGCGIVYVSHRLAEVLALSDRITVLRDGRVTLTAGTAALSAAALVEAMVGRQLDPPRPPPDPVGAPVALEVSGLCDPQGAFNEVSFGVRRGEIFGLYGLVGAGRTELGRALAGLHPAKGRIRATGRAAYLSEDRLLEGNLPGLGIRENLTISALATRRGPLAGMSLLWGRKERTLAESLRTRFSIRAPELEAEIGTLSGGNQQKVLLGRQLATRPEVLILDEPTQGIDVGARSEIHAILSGLAESGAAVVLITSDLPEALALCHRLAVMRRGRLVRTFAAGEAGEEEVARTAFGEEERTEDGDESGGRLARALSRALSMREAALVLTIVAIAGLTELRSPGFISLRNAVNIAANTSGLALAAIGQTVLIAAGAIDISIGSILALAATAAALWSRAGGGVASALGLAVLLGAALSSVNAGVSFLGRLHPLITTLGTLGIFRGLLLLWTGGEWIDLPDPLLALATTGPLGLPWSVWGTAVAAALTGAYLRWTRLGRAGLNAGDNPAAARAHGLPLWRARFAAFALLGAGVGLAGVFYTARFGKVQNDTGAGFELPAIAAAVLGGAHVAGGRGTVAGALLGAALIGLLGSARVVWGIHERWQLVAVGGLMLFALTLEVLLSRLAGARGRRV